MVGLVSNGFSIADPKDAGMLDVVGFDTAVPSEIAAVELPAQAAAYQNAPLQVFGPHEASTLAQMRNCMGVGFDIGCGNMAVRLDTPYAAIRDRAADILADVRRVVSFGVGRNNAERAEHALLDDDDAWRNADMEAYWKKAMGQLGTVGSGNHYVDLVGNEAGFVWIGVHFGSRGLGHTSATKYLDESPMAYRRLPDVLAQHAGTVRVLHTLRPFAVAMAGDGEFDPFKD